MAILAAKFFARRSPPPAADDDVPLENQGNSDQDMLPAGTQDSPAEPLSAEGWRGYLLPAYLASFLVAIVVRLILHVQHHEAVGSFFLKEIPAWLIPFLMGILVLYGFSRKVPVYEAVCEGAREGFEVALRIIPFLVAILVAIAIFRSSGALNIIIQAVAPLTTFIGMPADTLPMALVRPLSGSGAFAVMSDLVSRDPDSLSAFIASVMQGSTETTFYVLAIYFGAVGITRARYAIAAALLADLTGILAAVFWGNLFFRG